MAKQLNVNLAFTADTGKAKAQLQDLQNQLSQVINMSASSLSGPGMAENLKKASVAAAELKVHLENATNVKTGSLDFTKLNQSIKSSGSSLKDYAAKLSAIGPEGQKAFMMLAQSVASAEVPIRRSNALLTDLWTTMKNTARWQLTSSMLHGFMGAVQSAVGYAEDLNESLNNIRIVTGQSVEQMADFAKEANKAAKNLSTSTVNYTNAALIYYQQGLNEQEVKDRTDITVKMANVSRQSAEEVSDQMTAVWNNFAKGSEDLEHFADVMVRLGADTASSSDEIAGGLEKFASIGEMIGLSFDNAAAALATVTAVTRQSEDVVGTAFKTIFARIQGLNLGETLEDGTTLNKYSEALNKVGISIFDQNGELKDMDNILAEMGEKWKTLSKDQQVALAQTVAGVRQYNQLVSLMDNFDFYEQNLQAAKNSEGFLEEQAKIYEESWEAAGKRVRAALEGIWGTIIDDEAFIDILNMIEKLITGVDGFIDSIGGLGGTITALGFLFTNVFQKQINQSITNGIYSMQTWTERGRQALREQKSQEINNMLGAAGMVDKGTNSVNDIQVRVLKSQLSDQQELLLNAKNLNEEETKILQILLDQKKARGENAVQLAKELEVAKNKSSGKEINLLSKGVQSDGIKELKGQIKAAAEAKDDYIRQFGNYSVAEAYSGMHGKEAQQAAQKLVTANTEVSKTLAQLKENSVGASEDLNKFAESEKEAAELGIKLKQAEKEAKEEIDVNSIKTKENTQVKKENSQETNRATEETRENGDVNAEAAGDIKKHTEETKKNTDEVKKNSQAKEENGQKINRYTQNFTLGAQTVTGMATAYQSLNAAINTFNSDADVGTKIASMATSFTMFGSSLGMSLKSLSKMSVMTKGGTKALGELAASSGMASGLVTKLGLSTTSFGGAIIGMIPYLAIAAAAIGGLVFIGKELYNTYNADKIGAEKAAEAAQNLSKAVDEAASSLDGIVSAIDNYDSLIKTLEECEDDTDKWNEALKDVNNSIWDILEQYPELAKMSNLFNADGTLNRDTVDQFIEEKETFANNARAAALTSKARASQMQVRADQTDLQRSLSSQMNIVTPYDQQTGNTYQRNSDAIDNALSAIIKEFEAGTIKSTDDFNAIIDQVGKDFGITGSELESFKTIVKDSSEEIKELANSAIAANTQMNNVAILIAGEILGSDATEEQKEKFAQDYSAAEQAKYNEIYNKATGSGISKTSSKNAAVVKDLWAQYSEATGTNFQLDSNAVIGTDSNRYFQYIKDGITVKISAEELASAIAAADAKTGAENAIEEDVRSGLTGGLNDSIKEGVDTNLIVSLAEKYDLQNEESINNLIQLLNSAETIAEQEKILQDIINTLPDSQKQEAEINKLTASAEENYDLDPELIEEQAKQLQNLYGAEKLTEVAATKLAIENQRMNKGVEELSKNWEAWNKELKSGNKDSVGYAKTVKNLTKTVADLTGASADLELPEDFFDEGTGNLELLEKAAQGSEEAINALGISIAKSQINSLEQVDWTIDFSDSNDIASITTDKFNTAKETIKTGLDELQKKILEGQASVGDGLSSILEGSTTTSAEWVKALNDMALATHMSVDEMNSLLSEVGLDAEVSVTDIDTTVDVPRYKVVTDIIKRDEESGIPTEYTTRSIPDGTEKHPGKIQVAQIGANGEKPEDVKVDYIGNGSISPSSTGSTSGGGGGSSKKTPKAPKKSDTVERYKEINDALDDLEDAYNDTAKAADRLFGGAKLNELKKQNKLILDQKKALEQKKEEALANLKIDKEALLLAAKNAGANFQFDGDKIANYTEQMTMLHNQLEALHVTAGEELDEAEEKAINELQEKIEELKAAISAFEDTRELIEDLDNEIQDKFYEWQDNNYEQLQYELELKIEIEDAQLRKLEYFLNKYSDNFYKMAETAALMMDQGDANESKLGVLRDNKNDLDDAYSAGEISQADYIDGLKNVRDGVYESLEALIEMDKQMLHFFEDTLAAGQEELEDFTDHMEHLTSVFDHYLSLMDLLGKTKDYDGMGDFLEGKAQTIRDRLDVSQANYEILLRQEQEAEEAYKAALISGSDEEIELLKENWDAAVDAVDEAEEQMLSLTEEWVEAMKAVIDNNMAKISESLEKNLTNGMGFDYLMDQFDMLNTRQEEYLTKTNQIYETNKLMRTANKVLDETDNKVAKQKLQNFINETKSLQENNELSKLELEIQQAKYDLLLAEIALEEAQNAKATVRLQRDSEGNFGYVYTADQDAVNDAQQELADAENRLYNISLEGQQEYTEKYLQAQQEMHGKLNDLWDLYYNEHAISEEEYNRRMMEVQEQYCGVPDGILTKYSELYNIAVQADANATADNWTKQYGNMTTETGKWSEAVNGYIGQVNEQTNIWEGIQEQANADVKGALEDTTGATKDLTEESENLKNMIEDEVLPAIEDEYDEVREMTEAYAEQREGIQDLIREYENLIDVINEKIAAEARSAGTSSNSSSSDDFDPNIDYAAIMMKSEYGSDEYNEAAKNRDIKINEYKYSDHGVTTKELDAWIAGGMDPDDDPRKKKFVSLATGGYTGDWGPEGKLAILHEKELVLNEDDTNNLFKTIDFIRQIVGFIDSQASLSALSSLSAYNSSMNTTSHNLDQHVEIHAEFPNAVDHSEIEEAFNNLINTASQYANRKI